MAGTTGILDELEARHGGVRRYVATLVVVGGATRAEIAEAMAKKYGIKAPTGRSITKWKNEDAELRGLIQEMESAKRDVQPGGDLSNLLRPEVNKAQIDSDLFSMACEFPAFAWLMVREGERQQEAAEGAVEDGRGWFEIHDAPPEPLPDDPDDAPMDDVRAVLLAEHDSAEAFEADCIARLEGWEPHVKPTPGAGALAGYEPLSSDDDAA